MPECISDSCWASLAYTTENNGFFRKCEDAHSSIRRVAYLPLYETSSPPYTT